MSGVSNYLKPAGGLLLSALVGQQFNISTGALPFLGLLAGGQILAHALPLFAQKCISSAKECCQRKINHTELTHIEFRKRGFIELNLAQSPELTHIDLRDNLLTELNLTHNPKLRFVDLGFNRLLEVNLTPNPEIKHVYLNNNQITQIVLPQGAQLECLHLDDNRLESLPDSIFRLPSNCEVYLNGNTLSNQYIEEAQQMIENIRRENRDLGPQVYFGRQRSPLVSLLNSNLHSDESISSLKIN